MAHVFSSTRFRKPTILITTAKWLDQDIATVSLTKERRLVLKTLKRNIKMVRKYVDSDGKKRVVRNLA